ncbi:FadR/GntR family transcriptional regulator [Terracoccus luteus]|uniref:GntR family transcriptional regulator n=1 Tax=Terracoccus luteus TaxID=53356 RepID=A0A495XY54_9MICO|nr:GntR family transcriptional regulator [Terracoccus luteus]MBB2985319.1 GntR family transcriptional repressor for pyruvate dehydrogenase complex [Terracoccus luteus]MCP2170971.1 GntR family transcriptional repressor for pyruvate dehydrogenase complex [Terracoccus luteus]RKT77423.1 GntR family transcriptional regulator [Terracoccus luteus]
MSEAARLPTSLPEVVLRPTPGNAFENTVEQLATAIRLGVFAPDELLPPERELSERLEVSRATVREAIAALRDSGLVQTRPGRGGGTRVTYEAPSPPTAAAPTTGGGAPTGGSRPVAGACSGAALADALTFRRVVEPGAAWLAAHRDLAADERAWLEAGLHEVASATDPATHRVGDSRLHLAVATLSGSPMLVEAVTRSQAALHEMLMVIPVLPRNIAHSDEQHAELVAAILDGRPDRARSVMEEHCDATSALLRGLIG